MANEATSKQATDTSGQPIMASATDMTMFADPANSNDAPVMHTKTQSTLAPTAEFTRIFLLAWIIRYIFRGGAASVFNEKAEGTGLRATVLNTISAPGHWVYKTVFKKKVPHGELEAGTYSLLLGIGSGALSWSYSNLVRSDMKNIFSEAVAYEKNKPANTITFTDITSSDNKIVRQTVDNYRAKMWSRLGTDLLFFVAAPLRSMGIVDLLLGAKGVQIFADTWKRKTTMFEDLVTFINNKINPRNGLGQPVNVGEVFDLYQHYSEGFHPQQMFTNVLERGTGEGAIWAKSQPLFQRITDLMNKTYSYKHMAVINPTTGHAIHQADFALPKFIYMLGHDMIDIHKPEQTLALVEIFNTRGIDGLKKAQAMFSQNITTEQVLKTFDVKLPELPSAKPMNGDNNGVVAKGSTMQLDRAEGTTPSTSITTQDAALQAANENAMPHRSGVTV